VTDFQAYPGRSHFLIAASGWEEIADRALQWAEGLVGLGLPRCEAA
jgi:hypothetical protein